MAGPPVDGVLWPVFSRQYADWQRHGDDARAFLLDPGDDPFFEVFERQGVLDLVGRFEAQPNAFELKAIFGLLGARYAMVHGISPT